VHRDLLRPRPRDRRRPSGQPDEDGDRYIEIWNNVFMQFNRTEDGVMHRLPKPSVDTGMGLERLAAVLQHVHSNYEIDLFVALLAAAKGAVDAAGGGDSDAGSPSLKVIADHIRACAFTVADGVIPGNAAAATCCAASRGARSATATSSARACLSSTGWWRRSLPRWAMPIRSMRASRPASPRCCSRRRALLPHHRQRHGDPGGGARHRDEADRRRDRLQAARHLRLPGRPHGRCLPRARRDGGRGGLQSVAAEQKDRGREAGKFRMAQGLEYKGAPTEFRGYENS
jgi:alanyl-tRNA synthetase